MINYYFYIQGSSSVTAYTQHLSREGGIPEWSKKVNPMGVYSHSGQGEAVVVELQHILRYSKFRKTLQDLFGLKATMKVIFHVDERAVESEGKLTGVTTMLKILSTLLRLEAGDAILLSEDHDILIRRQEKAVILNNQLNFWSPDRMAKMQLPCELAVLSLPPGMKETFSKL